MALLEIEGLRRRFGGVVALDGASFAIEPGSITGLIGPNGAGKTTLFNCISGFFRPDGGRVTFAGTNITGLSADAISRAGMVRTFQIARGLPSLTVFESLMLYGEDQPGEGMMGAILRPRGVAQREAELRERARQVLERLELTHVANQLAGDLSGGQKKLIELGRTLMRRPQMILLDEPAAGVNPGLAKRLAGHILACRDEGITFLVVEHNMGLIAELCDKVVVMAEGRRLTEGTFSEVSADHHVQSAYMGSRQ